MQNQYKTIKHIIAGLNSVFSHIDNPLVSLLENGCCDDSDDLSHLSKIIDGYVSTQKNPGEINDNPYYVHWKDMNSNYIACNDVVARDTGFNMDTMIGVSDLDFDFLPRSQMECYRKHDQIVRTKEVSQFFIEPVTCANGKELITICHKSPLRLKSKKIIGTKCLAFLVDKDSYLLNILLQSSPSDEPKLTQRQLDCLYYLVFGMTMRQIADKLNLSTRTIEHYIELIKNKLNCHSRHEMIKRALKINSIRERL